MLSATLTILGALVTILGPVVAAWMVIWAEKRTTEVHHATMDAVDEQIKTYMAGNRTGLWNLSRQLERLHREASRKHRDPR